MDFFKDINDDVTVDLLKIIFQGLRKCDFFMDFIQGYLKRIIFFQVNFSDINSFQCLVFQGYFIKTNNSETVDYSRISLGLTVLKACIFRGHSLRENREFLKR